MASISIGVAADGKYLEIKNFNVNHTGHDGSEVRCTLNEMNSDRFKAAVYRARAKVVALN